MLSVTIAILLAIHIIVSLLIIFIVLMQRPKSEGLGSAFGGGMMESTFGAQATDVLAKGTRWLGGIFFVLTLILSVLYARQNSGHSSIQAAAIKAAEAAAAAQPSATPAANTTGTGTTVAPALTGTAAASPAAIPLSSAAPSPINTPAAPAAPAAGGTAGH